MKELRDKLVKMLTLFNEQIRQSEDVTVPDVENMPVDTDAGETELMRERLYHEINRTSRNMWAMDFLYFRRLEDKKLDDLALTNDELKLRLCGWLDNLIERFNHIEENL